MSRTTQGVRLLFVDDEEEFLESMGRALARRGLVVSTAHDAAEALALVEMEAFDVALLDIKMPGMDGVALYSAIARRHPDLPVIMLTGHGTVQQAFETSRDGVFDYLTKPCSVGDLVAVVNRAVCSRTAREERPPPHLVDTIRLLVVDDDIELLDSLSRALSRRGMTVWTAADGDEALATVQDQDIDVVVLDVRMPGMDGVEVLRLIKRLKPRIEVILLTGHLSVSAAFEGIRQGAFDFLIKPRPTDDLVDKIRAAHWLRLRRDRERSEGAVDEVFAGGGEPRG